MFSFNVVVSTHEMYDYRATSVAHIALSQTLLFIIYCKSITRSQTIYKTKRYQITRMHINMNIKKKLNFKIQIKINELRHSISVWVSRMFFSLLCAQYIQNNVLRTYA